MSEQRESYTPNGNTDRAHNLPTWEELEVERMRVKVTSVNRPPILPPEPSPEQEELERLRAEHAHMRVTLEIMANESIYDPQSVMFIDGFGLIGPWEYAAGALGGLTEAEAKDQEKKE